MKVGDCVQLQTGGCLMTIAQEISGIGGRREVECQWFNDEGELKQGRSAVESLRQWKLVDKPSSQSDERSERLVSQSVE